jgi:hypothetical protein
MTNIPYDEYDQQRDIKLLKREKFFRNQRKSFWKEDRDECSVLVEYNAAVDLHILWEDRFKLDPIIHTSNLDKFFINKINFSKS